MDTLEKVQKSFEKIFTLVLHVLEKSVILESTATQRKGNTMKTVEEIHEAFEQNDEKLHEAEMEYFLGNMSLKNFRKARAQHMYMTKQLNYQFRNRTA